MPELDYSDDQDQSEVFDEDNQNLDGEGAGSMDMRTLEELPDVMDFTHAPEDGGEEYGLSEEPSEEEAGALQAGFDEWDAAGQVDTSNGEVELFDAGDLNEASTRVLGEVASFEAETLDDDDLEDLGYVTRDADGEAHVR